MVCALSGGNFRVGIRRVSVGSSPSGRKKIAQRFIAGFAVGRINRPARDGRLSAKCSSLFAHGE
jgi:hypothetical protein